MGSFSRETPRCGRSQERSSDQKPSAVSTWTSQKPSPSSSRVLAPGVADGLVPVAPVLQPGVDAVLVGVDEGALRDGGLDDGSNGRLLDIGQHPGRHLAAALEQAEDRRLVLLQRAAAGGASQPAAPTGTPLSATAAGPCARPPRGPRRSRPRPEGRPAGAGRRALAVAPPSSPARPTRTGPAPARSAGSRGSGP